MKQILFFSILLVSLLSACNTEPDPINYGLDQCVFCEMTIVDKSHSAVLVSSKGKSFKFDAIECMVRYMNRNEMNDYAFILVTDFSNPGVLTEAVNGYFLITPEIPSPMGANLSAFQSKTDALSMQESKGGELLKWKEIMERFK